MSHFRTLGWSIALTLAAAYALPAVVGWQLHVIWITLSTVATTLDADSASDFAFRLSGAAYVGSMLAWHAWHVPTVLVAWLLPETVGHQWLSGTCTNLLGWSLLGAIIDGAIMLRRAPLKKAGVGTLSLMALALISSCAGCRHTDSARPDAVSLPRRSAADLPSPNARAGQVWVDPIDHGAMVFVPPGEYLVGAARGAAQVEGAAPNRPLHNVRLPGFWIDRQAVSNGRYRRFVEATGAPEPSNWRFPTRPMPPWKTLVHWPAEVTWPQARSYAEWAAKGLPTEDEWEAAARGTDGRRFPWGNEWPRRLRSEDRWARRAAIRLDVSPYGCLDMLFLHQWTHTVAASGEVIVKGDLTPSLMWLPPLVSLPDPRTWHRIPALWFRQEYPGQYRGWPFRCVLRPDGTR